VSFISKKRQKLKAALDGIFEGPIGPVKPKKRQYGANHYVPRTKPVVPEPSEDPIVLRPKEKPGAKRGYKVKRTNVVYTKPKKAKEPRPPKPRKIRGPVRRPPKPRVPKVEPAMAMVKADPEEKSYKPTQEEIARVISELKKRRKSQTLKPSSREREE
jgi:hypothetical protein